MPSRAQQVINAHEVREAVRSNPGDWRAYVRAAVTAYERKFGAPDTESESARAEERERAQHQICPVCGGCQTVPPNFYSRMPQAISTAREQCRRCQGLGTIALNQPTPTTPQEGQAT